MTVRLLALTKSVIPEIDTAEELIVYCARASNPANQTNFETGSKLLRYCESHEHWSIFEMGHAIVEIKTSRAISAQILRHRSFSFQEFSQRYSSDISDFEIHPARKQSDKNRQASNGEACDEATVSWFDDAQKQVTETARVLYQYALGLGIAREQARFLLPLSTGTRLYMSGSIRSWLHYVKLRTKPDTQTEHREIALEIREILAKEFPSIDWKGETE